MVSWPEHRLIDLYEPCATLYPDPPPRNKILCGHVKCSNFYASWSWALRFSGVIGLLLKHTNPGFVALMWRVKGVGHLVCPHRYDHSESSLVARLGGGGAHPPILLQPRVRAGYCDLVHLEGLWPYSCGQSLDSTVHILSHGLIG